MNAIPQRLAISRHLLPTRGLFTVFFAAGLLGLEFLGRYASTDIHDLVGAMALVLLSMSLVLRHRKSPLPWLRTISSWGRSALGGLLKLRYEFGIDLRGTPPVPRKTPRLVKSVVLGLIAWGVLSTAAWAVFPNGWRTIGVHSLYVVYLAVLIALWASLLTCFCIGFFVPITLLDLCLKSWLGETDRRGAIVAAVVGYAVLIALIACAVPASAILILCLVVAVVAGFVYLPRGHDGIAALWRARPNMPIYAVPLRRVMAASVGLVALLMFNILMMSCGGRLFGAAPEVDAMPITSILGAMTAWAMPLLLAVGGFYLFNAHRHDPARRTKPILRIRGTPSAQDLRTATRLASRWGWIVRTGPARREDGDVTIELVPQERSEATDFDPRWPLKVSLADLELNDVRFRLERRDEIQLRRHFFRGLSKLFKRAAPFKGPSGGGLWFAPHWWFFEGLTREDSDSSADDPSSAKTIGPPYHRVFLSRSRQHLHRVFRATQVDMVFIEDGVSPRKVDKVLRALMELYDVHGGKERADEMHFRGMPKIRVMIHDYEPGNPFESNSYYEPKFDDLSRVRVMHIFRDRGGHEEHIEPPADFSWTPAPVGMLS